MKTMLSILLWELLFISASFGQPAANAQTSTPELSPDKPVERQISRRESMPIASSSSPGSRFTLWWIKEALMSSSRFLRRMENRSPKLTVPMGIKARNRCR